MRDVWREAARPRPRPRPGPARLLRRRGGSAGGRCAATGRVAGLLILVRLLQLLMHSGDPRALPLLLLPAGNRRGTGAGQRAMRACRRCRHPPRAAQPHVNEPLPAARNMQIMRHMQLGRHAGADLRDLPSTARSSRRPLFRQPEKRTRPAIITSRRVSASTPRPALSGEVIGSDGSGLPAGGIRPPARALRARLIPSVWVGEGKGRLVAQRMGRGGLRGVAGVLTFATGPRMCVCVCATARAEWATGVASACCSDRDDDPAIISFTSRSYGLRWLALNLQSRFSANHRADATIDLCPLSQAFFCFLVPGARTEEQ